MARKAASSTLAPVLACGALGALLNLWLAIPLYPGAAVYAGAFPVFALALVAGEKRGMLAGAIAGLATFLATGDAVPLWAYPIEALLVGSFGRVWHPAPLLLAFWLLVGLPALAFGPMPDGMRSTTAALLWPPQELLAVLAAHLALMVPAAQDWVARRWPRAHLPTASLASLLGSFAAFLIVLAIGGTAWIQARQAYDQAADEARRAGARTAAVTAQRIEQLRGEYDRALARTATTPGLIDGERPEVVAAFVVGPDGRAERGWRESGAGAATNGLGEGREGAAEYESIPRGTALTAWAPPRGWAGAPMAWRLPAGEGRAQPVLVRTTPMPGGRRAAIVVDLGAMAHVVAATMPDELARIEVVDPTGMTVLRGPAIVPPAGADVDLRDVVETAQVPVGPWAVRATTPGWVLHARAEEALRRALPLMAGLMFLLGALGMALAGLLARELGRVDLAARDLVRQALDGREPGPPPRSALAEFQGLFATLGLVGKSLARAVRTQRAREAELAMANAQLTTTIEELRGVDHSRSEVLHAIGHDIKIPLTAVIGYAELLEDDETEPLGEQQRGFVRGIAENAERVVRLLGDLLDLARMEVGRFAIEPGAVDVAEFLDHTRRHLLPLSERKGHVLTVEPAIGLPRAWADPGRLDQVLTNLVSNAIKFTPAGGRIRLRAHVAPARDAVVVEVIDNGPGIPAEHLSKLFTRFYRVEGTTQPGTGLGLAISRKLVEAMGGQMGVLSEPGKGSTFWLTVPTQEAAQQAAEAGEQDPGRVTIDLSPEGQRRYHGP